MVIPDILTHHGFDLAWNTVLTQLTHSVFDTDHLIIIFLLLAKKKGSD